MSTPRARASAAIDSALSMPSTTPRASADRGGECLALAERHAERHVARLRIVAGEGEVAEAREPPRSPPCRRARAPAG
jgi:hypothetical protein